MANFLKNLAGTFMSNTQANIETVRAKLAAVDVEISAAETVLQRTSLDAVLSDDVSAGYEPIAQLQALRTRRELLERALAAAEQAERDRLDTLWRKAEKAKLRALRQHAERLERAAAAMATAQAAGRDAFNEMIGAAFAARAVLPDRLREHGDPFGSLLGAVNLRALCQVGAYRLSRGDPVPLADARPGLVGQYEDRATGALPSLPELIGSICNQIRNRIDDPPLTELPRDEKGIAAAAADGASPPVSSAAHPSPHAVEPLDGIVLDLRGRDLSVTEAANG